MIPSSKVAAQLRHIASKLEKSKNPNRSLVSKDLRKIIAGIDDHVIESLLPDGNNDVQYKVTITGHRSNPGGMDTDVHFEQVGGSGKSIAGPSFDVSFHSLFDNSGYQQFQGAEFHNSNFDDAKSNVYGEYFFNKLESWMTQNDAMPDSR